MTHPGRQARLDAADAAVVLKTRKMLTQNGLDGEARRMGSHLSRVQGLPTVVVVGEVRRGKTSLVNALAGAEVSPPGHQTGSGAVVAVVPPSETLPLGQAELVYPDRREQRPLTTVWAAAVEDSEERPQGVRVTAASPWVPGMSLVDTPGIGGMQASHLLAARAAAESGTAVLFVADGAQPLSAPELAFLAEMSEQTERVVLALTKIDRNPGAWEEVRVDNVRLLKVHAPRLARQTFHATSAAYALHALQQPDDVAAALNLASGIPALAEELRHVAAGSGALALANALRVGQHGLGMLEQNIEQQLALVAGTNVAAADLTAERDRLEKLRQRQRRSKSYLERDVNRIRSEAIDAINRGADDVAATLTQRISTERRKASDDSKAQFADELTTELAQLAADLQQLVSTRIAELQTDYLGPLGVRADDPAGRVAAPTFKTRVRERHTLEGPGGLDPGLPGAILVGGNILALIGFGGLPGYLIGGGAMAAMNARFRSSRQGQHALLGTLNDTVAGARNDLVAAVDAWLRELRPELLIAVEDRLGDELTQARTLIAQAERVQQQDAAALRSEASKLMLRRDALRAKRLAVERRLLELDAAPRAAAPPFGTFGAADRSNERQRHRRAP